MPGTTKNDVSLWPYAWHYKNRRFLRALCLSMDRIKPKVPDCCRREKVSKVKPREAFNEGLGWPSQTKKNWVLWLWYRTHSHSNHGPNYYTTSDWLGPENGFENVMKRDHDVLKPHEGRPRCFGTMVQNIILPQIGLAQEMGLKTLWRETTMKSATGDHMKGDHDEIGHGRPKCKKHWKKSVLAILK